MEDKLDALGMLDLMTRPGFCVKENIIVKANQAALSMMLTPGTEIAPLLHTGKEEYAGFRTGCLYLTLELGGEHWNTSVTAMGDHHIFLLEQDEDQAELRAMALAARELREPLAKVMATADRLFPMSALEDDPAIRDQVAHLNKGLLQMLRVIGNMSDAGRYSAGIRTRMEICDVTALMQEIFDRSAELIAHAELTLHFRNLPQAVDCLVDKEKLERAVLNILSNAIKFTPRGGTIDCTLTRQGNLLSLQIQDSGPGISEFIRGNIYDRYKRQPGLEEGRFGIGLGMVLVRSAATIHGGTILVDQPANGGTRITMTMAIRKNTDGVLRSPVMHVDYSGEWDHMLIELADGLPAPLYEQN